MAVRNLVLLSGGGTLGHLAPGFALRDALSRLGIEARFSTPGEDRERDWFPRGDPAPYRVPAPRLSKEPASLGLLPARLAMSVGHALALLERERPAAVVGLGGWPCAPVAVAAILRRTPLFLLAADAVPGVVVRRLSRFAARTYVATPEAREALPAPERAVSVGRAVRNSVLAARPDPARFDLDPARRTLFVVGGSIGAAGLNRRVRDGLRSALAADPSIAARIQAIHSTGRADGEEAATREAYATLGIPAFVAPYVEDVGTAYATAALVLARAGAGTVAELEALGTPAVLVPYPHHADRQQHRNAEPLVRRGAAAIVEEEGLDAAAFAREVLGRLLDPSRTARMRAAAEAARASRPPGGDAASAIATDLVRWMEGGGPSPGRAPPSG